jgi:hypothetical protein
MKRANLTYDSGSIDTRWNSRNADSNALEAEIKRILNALNEKGDNEK